MSAAILGIGWFVIAYYIALNTWFLFLIVLAGIGAIGHWQRESFSDRDKIFRSPLAVPVSLIVPVRDAEDQIVPCVRGLVTLRYPEFEVIVVDDGSADSTFERMRTSFDLVEVEKVSRQDVPVLGAVRSVHAPRDGGGLLVVRKDSVGRPADAINAGVNMAGYPLVCRVDADAYLDAEALLSVVKPIIEDPGHVVASGSTVRVANGARMLAGRVVAPHMPARWLPRMQAVEYLRAFLLGRAGWAQLRALFFISGVFTVFRRDVLVDAGGLDPHSEAEDIEIIARLHRRLYRRSVPNWLYFVPEPCCWTDVPETYSELRRQRQRWAQNLAESLWQYRSMIANPRYGVIGMVTMPYFLIFELFSSLVELVALVVFPVGLALGVINVPLAILFLVAAIGYASFLSVISILIEQLSYNRYYTWRDIWRGILAAVAENFGYRQVNQWWRIQGIVGAMRRRRKGWAGVPDEPATARPAH